MNAKLLSVMAIAPALMAAAAGQTQPARYYNPRFAADSSRVIFESTREGKMTIYSINTDGTGLSSLTKNDVFDSDPSWAAALKRIFFSTTRNGTPELFSMNADGTDQRRIADFTGNISPDGRFVTYSKVVDGRSGIFVRDLAGGAEKELSGGT